MPIRPLAAAFLLCKLTLHAEPHWIQPIDWSKQSGLHHNFNVPAKIKHARLRIIADAVNVQLRINGKTAAVAEMFGPVVELNAKPWLVSGKNEISLISIRDGRSWQAHSAVALELMITVDSGETSTLVTSPKWNQTKSLGDLGKEKWWNLPNLVIDEGDDYTQWKRASNAKEGTDPATIKLLPNFKAELLRSAAKDEGSWVSIAFDGQGRLTVAREDKGLIRYTLSNNHQKIIKAENIDETLKECRGLLYAHKSLYVNANNSKGLYRLRDTNGDGKFNEKILLHSSEGGLGHGRNDLALGPDGNIYAIHGDAVHLPENITDLTSPLRKMFQPFRKNEGHVIRLNHDGSEKEIFCGGLRNPYGIAFNAHGEAFTYDADAEFDMGTPWYRPTQVKHLTSGADFGWRAVTGSWPPYFPDHPDNTQPTLDIGKGSPTGVKFGTRSNFPPDYRNALYILDWTYGRILAVHLRPRGSTYMGAAEEFLRGQPLNVTDLDFGPDGAMYFVTGGRKTQSALYRVSYTGPFIKPRTLTKAELNRQKLAKEYRENRKRAEKKHHDVRRKFVFASLPEPRTNHAWRIALEKDGLTSTMKAAPNFETLTAHANIALSKGSAKVMLINEWPELLPSEQLAYLDLIRRNMARNDLPAKTLAAIQSNLQPYFPGDSPKVNQSIAPLLIQLDPANAVTQTLRLLDGSTNQRERIYYLHHLRHAKTGWTLKGREIYFRILNEYDAFLGGRGLPQALERIRKDATATLSEKEKKSLAKEINKKPTIPPLPDLSDRKFVKQWKTSDFFGNLDLRNTNPDNGQKIFHLALCSRCHRKGKEGYPVGPDLTFVARRFDAKTLITEILEPSKTIAENYHTTLLRLQNGRTLAGQIIPNFDYREPSLQIAENPLYPNKVTQIMKADIVARSKSDTSVMPPGLLNQMNKKEILDLLSWLKQ